MTDEHSIDIGQVRNAASVVHVHADAMRAHGKSLTSKTAAPVGSGPLGEVVGTFVRRIMHAAGEGAAKAGADFLRASADGLEKTAARVEYDDGKVGSSFERLGPAKSVVAGGVLGVGHHASIGGVATQGLRVEVRNGYTYHFDERGRVARIEGQLRLNPAQERNRAAQLAAGRGHGRLETDQGGHFIGRLFDGPTDDFNHFAQDGNFNMGRFRSLESRWKAEMAAGKIVKVDIQVAYGDDQRPRTLAVTSSVEDPGGGNAHSRSHRFYNMKMTVVAKDAGSFVGLDSGNR